MTPAICEGLWHALQDGNPWWPSYHPRRTDVLSWRHAAAILLREVDPEPIFAALPDMFDAMYDQTADAICEQLSGTEDQLTWAIWLDVWLEHFDSWNDPIRQFVEQHCIGPDAKHLGEMLTREGARQLKGYHEGRVVAFQTNLPSQKFQRGERGDVVDIKDGKVELHMGDGELRTLDPSRLPANLKHDAVTIFERKRVALHEQDRIRWTAKDSERGLANGDIAYVERIDGNNVMIKAGDGKLHELPQGDPMLERLDLAYAINVHVAQGMTAKDGIIMMSERERALNSTASFLVAVTRIAEHATLVTDNPNRVQRQVETRTGEKTSAMDVTETKTKSPEHYPSFKEDLQKLSEKLGPEYAMAVLQNRERDITLEKPIGRGSEPARDKGEPARDIERSLDVERSR